MPSRPIGVFVRVAFAVLLVWVLVSRLEYLRANVSERDSVAYWAAGRLLFEHHNPYETGVVHTLEQHQGYQKAKPLVLRTPPWSLFIVLPLGTVDAFRAWILWVAFLIGSLLLVMRLCWKIYGDSSISQSLFWLVGYGFAPIPACLVAGQMGIILLLGLTLFLWFEADHPWVAGAALLLPFAKPHLLSLFWVALLFWIVKQKRYQVAGGISLAVLAATGVALAFDSSIFRHYREMLNQAAIGSEFIPALSGVLRLLFFRQLFWMQFIPMATGLLWCVWFCYANRHNWRWRDQGMAVIVVSVLTTPYSWLTDEVVLLPAMLQALVSIIRANNRLRWSTRLVLLVFACLNGLLLLILTAKVPFSTGIYFWSSLVWCAFYFYGRRRAARSGTKERLIPVD